MEQNMRFGQILGRLAILEKKIGQIMSNFCGRVFSCFQGQKRNFFKCRSIHTTKLHNISFIKFYFLGF